MSHIAPLSAISNSLDTFAKLIRVLEREGITNDHLFLPINDKIARANLATYLRAGCPKASENNTVRTSFPKKVLANLLEQAGNAMLLTSVERFVACEKLVVDRNGELPISCLCENFRTNFLALVEERMEAVMVEPYTLLKSSKDGPILVVVGDNNIAKVEKAKMTLAHTFEFLKTADRSKWFIFYIVSVKGVVWAVNARWYDNGWRIEAFSFSSPTEWSAGYQFVFPCHVSEEVETL